MPPLRKRESSKKRKEKERKLKKDNLTGNRTIIHCYKLLIYFVTNCLSSIGNLYMLIILNLPMISSLKIK